MEYPIARAREREREREREMTCCNFKSQEEKA